MATAQFSSTESSEPTLLFYLRARLIKGGGGRYKIKGRFVLPKLIRQLCCELPDDLAHLLLQAGEYK